MTLSFGDNNATVLRWRQVMSAMFGGTAAHPGLYTRLHGPLGPTTLFGQRAVDWQQEYERRTGQMVDGIVSDQDLFDLKVVIPHRPIWCYSAPGSGVPCNVGPPFDLGERCKHELALNHVPLCYDIGGYMGFMGGDPKNSYLDIIAQEDRALEHQLDANPDVQAAMAKRRADPHCVLVYGVDVELWLFSYSQSAEGMKRAAARLFGDGGKYALIRDRLNGVIAWGDPTRKAGITKIGNTPVGEGISGWRAPDWLEAITYSITNESPTPDFYAACVSKVAREAYTVIVRAATSLPFVVYLGQIAIPAFLNLIAPWLGPLGGLAAPMAGPIIAGQAGLPMNLVSTMLGGIGGAGEAPDPELIKMLSLQGLLTSAPDLLMLLMATPGIAVHGDYYAPKPEFGGRSGFDVAFDIIASFRGR